MTALDIIEKLRKMFVEKNGVIDGVTIPISRNRAGEIVAFDSPELVRYDLRGAIVAIAGWDNFIEACDAAYYVYEAQEQQHGTESQEITEPILIMSILNRAYKMATKEAIKWAAFNEAKLKGTKLNETKVQETKMGSDEENLDGS